MKDIEEFYPFKLTGEQHELLDRLLNFCNSEKNVFILKGYAGTGKTSIMLGLTKYFSLQKRPIVLMASTGRAAKVLAQKAKHSAATVHGSIYALQIVELPKSNDKGEEADYHISFKPKMSNIDDKVIYFIDESSMLTNTLQRGGSVAFGTGRLLDDLFRFTNKGKVVFIGDPAQLPPVNSKFSAALSSQFLQTIYNFNTDGFELRKVMRYKENSGIFFNTRKLREIIASGYFPQLSIRAHGFDDIEVHYNINDMVKSYYNLIKTLGVDAAIYITLSNKVASIVNKKIRVLLWGHRNINILRPNESLMVVRNNNLYGLSNGDLITVDKIEKKLIRMANLEFRHIHIRVTNADPSKGIDVKRVLIINDLLNLDSRDLSAEQDIALLKNFFGRMTKIANEVFYILNSGQSIEKRRSEIISKINNSKMLLDVNDLLEEAPSKKALRKAIIAQNMMTDPFLNALRVKYGYAITCHKAQGSEWQQVFIHLEKSMFYLDKDNQHRWTYTALSRAEQKIHILNNICLY